MGELRRGDAEKRSRLGAGEEVRAAGHGPVSSMQPSSEKCSVSPGKMNGTAYSHGTISTGATVIDVSR